MSGSGNHALAAAVLTRALRFDRPDAHALRALDDAGWNHLLDAADRTHMTLALATRLHDALPGWVRERVERDLAGNNERLRRTASAYEEIAAALGARSIDWVVLKGFSHNIPFRPQYDIDLLCRPDQALAAQEAVVGLGYEPITGRDEFPADHLPLLIRRTGWRWRDDYWDPEMPANVEIHYRLWDASTERLEADGVEEFWGRRETRSAGGLTFQAFDPADTLAYAALHVLRHLLRGDLLLWHVYELAFMLESRSGDEAFWQAWNSRYSESLRSMLDISIRLAQSWFGCRVRQTPVLPPVVERWFETYARQPAGVRLFAAKSELWLHVSLLKSRRDAFGVIRRKLLPMQARRSVHYPHLKPSEHGLKLKLDRAARHSMFIAGRAVHHARTLPPAVVHGILWWLRSRESAVTNSRTSRT